MNTTINQPTREQLAPHVQVVIHEGAGGYVRLGNHIRYAFLDATACRSKDFAYSMMREQCLDRAIFAFSRPDEDTMVSNGRAEYVKTIKDDLISLVAQ